MKQIFDNRLFTFLFLITLSAMIFILYMNLSSWGIFRTSYTAVEHTYEVIHESEELLSTLKDVETGSRGFVITGREKFLTPYNRASPQVMIHFNRLRQLTSDNPIQSRRIDSLQQNIELRLDNALRTILTRKEKEFISSDLSLIDEGKVYMDKIRKLISELQEEELKLLEVRKQTTTHVQERSQRNFLILSIVSMALFVSGFSYVGYKMKINKSAEEEFRELLESAPDAIVVVNEKGTIELVNRQTEKMFGYTRDELLNHSIEILIPGEFHGKHIKFRSDYMKEPGVRPMGTGRELFGQRKNETKFPVEISLSPMITKRGKFISAAIRDITDKKKVQEELHQLNAELEQKVQERTAEIADYKYALDESCIVAITDQRGVIRYANKNFCAISKYSEEELIGQDHRIINSGYHSREFIRNLWVTIANGNIWRGELKNKAKDGTFYWVDTTIVPFLNNLGKPYQYVAIRSDITRRKQVEEELQQLNSELEQQVKERTQQLEQMNEELEAFTYSVSHDLRAPLRIIDGYGDILVSDFKEKLDEEANRLLNVIMSNARHMGQLIDDLLNLSRLGRKDLNLVVTDMNALVSEVIGEQKLFSSSKIKLIKGDLLPVLCDPTLVKQIWVNLISNAVKYSSSREESIIEIGSFETKGEYIYMVKDNGVGFNMEYSGKLFGVFQRLHKMTDYPGTGVGLAIVKRIVMKHGGRVWASAEQDKGATFYFSLNTQNNEQEHNI